MISPSPGTRSQGTQNLRADGYDHWGGYDDYTKAGNLFRLMKPDEKERRIGNLVAAMKPLPKEIQERQLVHFCKAGPDYGEGVVKGLGRPVPKAA